MRARQTTAPQMLPSPAKGWNTRDAFPAQDPLDALLIDNFQPDYGGVQLREGTTIWRQLALESSGVGGPAELAPITTLAIWRGPSGAAEMIAAQGGSLFACTKGDLLGRGFVSGWWDHEMFRQHLFLVNGAAPPQVFDGTSLAAAGFVADPTSPYPLNVNLLAGVASVHNRLLFWTGKDAGFWYGPLQGITGNLNFFPLDMVTEDGAWLTHVMPLTYDGGLGIATYTVLVMSSGHLLIYSGSDPTVPATAAYPDAFALVGDYQMPIPIGGMPPRATTRYGGDAYVVTSSDYLKLSQLVMALRMGVQPPRSKATGACLEAVAESRDLPGWQAIYWGYGRRLLVNVPQNDGSFRQHVYNTGLDAWCSYSGLLSYTWVVWDDALYFGSRQGYIMQFGTPGAGGDQQDLTRPPWNTTKWNTTLWITQHISDLTATAQQTWNVFGTPQQKRIAAMRPIVRSAQGVTYKFGLGFDYNPVDYNITADHVGTRTLWNVTPWGTPWERPAATDTVWYITTGDGSAASVALTVTTNTNQPLTWIRTDLRIEPGQAL
jgi:hypothetical protein